MKRMLVLGTAALALTLALAPPAWSFDWKDVAEMHQDSISDQLIIEKINHSGSTFDLNAKELRQLKAAGVSDQVITAMLRTEDRNGGDGGSYAGHPYVPYYWYDPYYARFPRTGIVMDFGFGYSNGYGWGHGSRYRGGSGHGGYRGDGGHRGGGGGRGDGGRGGRGGHGGGRH
jgi:hypothetical protein